MKKTRFMDEGLIRVLPGGVFESPQPQPMNPAPLPRFGEMQAPAGPPRPTSINEATAHLLRYGTRIDSKEILKLEDLRNKARLLEAVSQISKSPEEQSFYLGISVTAVMNWKKDVALLNNFEAMARGTLGRY